MSYIISENICHIKYSLQYESFLIARMIYIVPAELETTELVDSLSRDGILFTLFNIDHVTDLHALLVRLYLSNVPVNKDVDVVILCYFFCVRRILRTVRAAMFCLFVLGFIVSPNNQYCFSSNMLDRRFMFLCQVMKTPCLCVPVYSTET